MESWVSESFSISASGTDIGMGRAIIQGRHLQRRGAQHEETPPPPSNCKWSPRDGKRTGVHPNTHMAQEDGHRQGYRGASGSGRVRGWPVAFLPETHLLYLLGNQTINCCLRENKSLTSASLPSSPAKRMAFRMRNVGKHCKKRINTQTKQGQQT